MSAFLGPIHFWLYNKIQFQENLIDELVAYVTAKGWSDKADQYVSLSLIHIFMPMKSCLNCLRWIRPACLTKSSS